MSRRTTRPTSDHVELAITALTEATGTPPTALAVADRLGLANTIFRRHFPDLAARLAQQRSARENGLDRSRHRPVRPAQARPRHAAATTTNWPSTSTWPSRTSSDSPWKTTGCAVSSKPHARSPESTSHPVPGLLPASPVGGAGDVARGRVRRWR